MASPRIRIVCECDKCNRDIDETEQFYVHNDIYMCQRCFNDFLVEIEAEAERIADDIREEILND